jgi:hypothetical protein
MDAKHNENNSNNSSSSSEATKQAIRKTRAQSAADALTRMDGRSQLREIVHDLLALHCRDKSVS